MIEKYKELVVERRSLDSVLGHFVFCDNSLHDFLYKLYPHLSVISKPMGSNFITYVPSLSPQLASLISSRHSNFICLSSTYADLQLTVADIAGLALDFATKHRACRRRKITLPKGQEFKVISALLDTSGFVEPSEESFPEVFQKIGTAGFSQSFLEYASTNPHAIRSVATFINNVYQTVTTGVGSAYYQKTAARLRSKLPFLPKALDSNLGDYPNDIMSFVFFHNTLFKI